MTFPKMRYLTLILYRQETSPWFGFNVVILNLAIEILLKQTRLQAYLGCCIGGDQGLLALYVNQCTFNTPSKQGPFSNTFHEIIFCGCYSYCPPSQRQSATEVQIASREKSYGLPTGKLSHKSFITYKEIKYPVLPSPVMTHAALRGAPLQARLTLLYHILHTAASAAPCLNHGRGKTLPSCCLLSFQSLMITFQLLYKTNTTRKSWATVKKQSTNTESLLLTRYCFTRFNSSNPYNTSTKRVTLLSPF